MNIICMYRLINRFQRDRQQQRQQIQQRQSRQNQQQQPRQNQQQTPFVNQYLLHNRGLRFQRRLLPRAPAPPSHQHQPPRQPPPLTTRPRQPIPIYNNEPMLSLSLNETNFYVYEHIICDLEEEILRQSRIYANTIRGKYKQYKNRIKNDTCPILLNAFEDDTIISCFLPCKHAIDSSTMDDFVIHFHKCPLCNAALS